MNETKWPKFRLKMDTPDHRAGEIFWRTDNWMICDDEDLEEGRAFKLDNIKHFDEWFEEVKEPTWVRKQIERVDITALSKSGESGYKIQYRFIRPFYYDDTEWGVDVYAKNSTSHQPFWMNDKPDELDYLNKVALINQLARDGYIEIQDNPNIVWEETDG